jgi:EmrB/QacA subfamily drug resistance transporter
MRLDRLVPLVVATALFMENLDGTVISTALPPIAVDLGEDPVNLKLAFTSYYLSLAVFLPISGWTADRFGARRVFCAAMVVFTLASLACGMARSLEELVVARAFQGLGGALMMPVGRMIVLRAVEKSQLIHAMAYLTVPALIGPLLGPPLGGFIATFLHWRWIFLINLPIGMAGLWLAARLLPEFRAANVPRLDVLGFLLSGAGLAMLMFGFTTLNRSILPDFAAPTLCLAGAVALGLYVVHWRRRRDPILDLALLGNETLRTSIIGGSLFRIGAGALPFLLPLLLQIGFGYTAFEAGSITFAAAGGAILMKFVAPQLLRTLGFRTTLAVNALLCGAMIAVKGLFTVWTPYLVIGLVMFTGGFFRSLQFTSLNAIAYADVPAEEVSRATSLYSVAQQLSIALGVAVAALVLDASRQAGSGVLEVADIRLAFFVVAMIVASSALVHLRLGADAGEIVSGRRSMRVPEAK